MSIGGTVSGLVGTVVLQNNGVDNLSLTKNGAFTFPTSVSSGAAYAVTVLTQPPGPTCTVSNGTGHASANVSSVSVTCTTDPATVFLPLTASPTVGSTGGTTGLYVVSSKALDGAPILLSSQVTTSVGFLMRLGLGAAGTITSSSPYALAYTTLGAAGGDHLWTVDLTGSSTLAPRQVGSLTIPYTGSAQTCATVPIMKNLTDPTTTLFILAVPTDTTNLCSGAAASIHWMLARFTDSTATAPVTLPSLRTPIVPIYKPSGALAGLVMIDALHNLNFYPDETFANPVPLLANVAQFSSMQDNSLSPLTNLANDPTYSFLVVYFTTGSQSLYRLDATGSLSADLYDFQGSWGTQSFDASNFYFTDLGGTATSLVENIVQVPNTAATPAQVLYTFATPGNLPYYLMGTAGNTLLLERNPGINAATGWVDTELATLPIGTPATPTTIASFALPADVSVAAGDVFVTLMSPVNYTPWPFSYASQVLASDGTVIQGPTAQSSVLPVFGTRVIEVRSISDPGGLGGGSLTALDLSVPASPLAITLARPGGSPYTLPGGTILAAFDAVSPTIGVGHAQDQTQVFGLAYDLAKQIIVPVTMANSNVQFLRRPF